MSRALSLLAQQLVAALVPDSRDQVLEKTLASHVVRQIRADTHGGARKEWPDIREDVEGLSRTAKVRVQDDLAEALEKNLAILDSQRRRGTSTWDDEGDVNMRNLPQYIHLLLNLADRPTTSTHDFAYSYLHRQPPSGPTADQILFREIMESEPFDPGETWDEEVRSGWTESDDSHSDTTESPVEEDIRTPSSAVLRSQRRREQEERRRAQEEDQRLEALEVVRDLKNGYWLSPGDIGELPEGMYGWKDLSVGANAAAIARSLFGNQASSSKAITATQLQRELLFALSGRSGVMMTFAVDGTCSVVPGHPQVHHLSPAALEDVLDSFKGRSTQAAQIRRFILATLQPSSSPVRSRISLGPKSNTKQRNKTQQAFAEACRGIMAGFDGWLSELEASFTSRNGVEAESSLVPGVLASTAPSILRLELDKRYSAILEWLNSFFPHSASPVALINLIHATINSMQQHRATDHLPTLYRLFLDTVRPTWKMLTQWLQYGMPVPPSLIDAEEAFSTTLDESDERQLDSDFFIKRDRDVSWADEDFWESGFTVGEEGWPDWLGKEVGELVLEAGKARGLSRSLIGGVGVVEQIDPLEAVLDWDPTGSHVGGEGDAINNPIDIADRIANHLRPMCQITQFHLRRVLDEDCGLEDHLDAIEGVMYHRGFQVLHEWAETLFQKVSNNERWADFHALTSTFREVIERKEAGWMNPAAIRIRTIRSPGAYAGPRALGAIRPYYEVPFPLSQMFTPTSIELRSEVFTFLLQVQMARYIMEQTKVYDRELLAQLEQGDGTEIRAMWIMRQKTLWLMDVLFTWLTARVIEVQAAEFRRKLEEMTSLRLMIALELEHARKIRDYAFLHPATSELYEAIQGIFDLSHTLSECFISYLAQPNLQAQQARRPTVNYVTDRRRRRRRRRASISSDEEEQQGEAAREVSISFVELSLGQRMGKMGKELEDAVSELKGGVEQLAMADEGEVWGMLAFALEEWE